MESLESQRLERMKQGGDETNTQLSADALLSRKLQRKSDKVLISYDKSGKMNKNQEFDKALEMLKNKNRGNGRKRT